MESEKEKTFMKRKATILLAVFAVLAIVEVPSAGALPTITFYNNLTEFNTAAGSPPVVVNFDDIAPGTDITNQTINGVTFKTNLQTVSAPLIVVKANDTYTSDGFSPAGNANNTLFATSGSNVLSPGGIILGPGPNATLENDDLTLIFANPVASVGFDVLFQSLDGSSYTSVAVLDASDNILYQGTISIPAKPNSVGGAVFVGFVSNSTNIAKIVVDDKDGNASYPDANIGFDTIRVGEQVVPEFPTIATIAVLFIILTVAMLLAKKKLAPVSMSKKAVKNPQLSLITL